LIANSRHPGSTKNLQNAGARADFFIRAQIFLRFDLSRHFFLQWWVKAHKTPWRRRFSYADADFLTIWPFPSDFLTGWRGSRMGCFGARRSLLDDSEPGFSDSFTISPREIVKNDLKRRQRALRRLKSTVTWQEFGAIAQTRIRTMPAR
jgi:hypothetical protein